MRPPTQWGNQLPATCSGSQLPAVCSPHIIIFHPQLRHYGTTCVCVPAAPCYPHTQCTEQRRELNEEGRFLNICARAKCWLNCWAKCWAWDRGGTNAEGEMRPSLAASTYLVNEDCNAVLLPYVLWDCVTCYCERISREQDPLVRPCGRRRHVAAKECQGPAHVPHAAAVGEQQVLLPLRQPQLAPAPPISDIFPPHPAPAPICSWYMRQHACLTRRPLDGASHFVQRNIAKA